MRQPTVSELHGTTGATVGYALQVRASARETRGRARVCDRASARVGHPCIPARSAALDARLPAPAPPPPCSLPATHHPQIAANASEIPELIPHIKEEGGSDIIITHIKMLVA